VADHAGRVLTVGDLMTTRVVATSPDDPVADAAAAMVRQKTGSALIMEGRFLAGILTERDVLRAAASGTDLAHSPVSAWMTKDPEPAFPETTVEDATQLMLLHGFRHLPVLAGREVCGVVSLRDLAAARIRRRTVPPAEAPGPAEAAPRPVAEPAAEAAGRAAAGWLARWRPRKPAG
jgi:CBS domain-containing protein